MAFRADSSILWMRSDDAWRLLNLTVDFRISNPQHSSNSPIAREKQVTETMRNL